MFVDLSFATRAVGGVVDRPTVQIPTDSVVERDTHLVPEVGAQISVTCVLEIRHVGLLARKALLIGQGFLVLHSV